MTVRLLLKMSSILVCMCETKCIVLVTATVIQHAFINVIHFSLIFQDDFHTHTPDRHPECHSYAIENE